MSESVDVLIVGAGPVGLFGAYYAGVRTLSVAVLDSLEEPGGQITAMYPEKAIFDVAGFPAIRGRELVDQLVRQAAPFSPSYWLGHQAVGLERGDGKFAVTTSAGRRIECPRDRDHRRNRHVHAPAVAGRPGVSRPRLGALRSRSGRLRGTACRGRRWRRLGGRLGVDARTDRQGGDPSASPGSVPRPPAFRRVVAGVDGRVAD